MTTSVPSPLKFIPHKKQYKLGSFDKVKSSILILQISFVCFGLECSISVTNSTPHRFACCLTVCGFAAVYR